MNDLELTSKEIAEIRLKYPPGTRLMLIIMEDSYAVPSGTRGTVDYVDDAGQIHMNWDNGRSLAIVPQIDQFRKLTKFELMEEADPSVLPHPKLLGTAKQVAQRNSFPSLRLLNTYAKTERRVMFRFIRRMGNHLSAHMEFSWIV